MNWLDRLEKRFGRFAIKNLMTYIVAINALVFLLETIITGGTLTNFLILDPSLVLKGEVWRLVTFIFIPPSSSMIWIIFVLYFYYIIGNGLEQEWGSFKFNLFYFFGIIGTAAATFITLGFGEIGYGTATYINLSLFLAFARIYPDYEVLLFFILPVKMKYLAWLNWFFFGYTILTASLPLKIAAAAAILNYFIFFGKDILRRTKSTRNSYYNRRKFKVDLPKRTSIHKCTVCGITENDDPMMEFRYCSKCQGHYEYCSQHLFTHEHKK